MLACLLLPLGATATAADGSPPAREIGAPVRLTIPAIAVDARIEGVALTPDGAMDTPKDPRDTAWYRFGPRPGEPGNAVIAGHVDTTGGGEAVFWSLRRLAPGDAITVTSDDGIAHRFVVTGAEKYAAGSAPLAAIFGSADGVHLNLITCDPETPFDRTSGEYGGHLLVRADAVP